MSNIPYIDPPPITPEAVKRRSEIAAEIERVSIACMFDAERERAAANGDEVAYLFARDYAKMVRDRGKR